MMYEMYVYVITLSGRFVLFLCFLFCIDVATCMCDLGWFYYYYEK